MTTFHDSVSPVDLMMAVSFHTGVQFSEFLWILEKSSKILLLYYCYFQVPYTVYFLDTMLDDKVRRCKRCKHSLAMASYRLCPHCRIPAGKCQQDYKKPCSMSRLVLEEMETTQEIADRWSSKVGQGGRKHWTAAFFFVNAWLNQPVSTRSSSGHRSEISSSA